MNNTNDNAKIFDQIETYLTEVDADLDVEAGLRRLRLRLRMAETTEPPKEAAPWSSEWNLREALSAHDRSSMPGTQSAGVTVTSKNPNSILRKNPNSILRRIRSSVVTLSQRSPAATPPAVQDLIQAIKDLDNHLSWGGTPPDDWSGASLAASTTQTSPTQVSTTRPHEPDPVEDIIRRM
jgi:hypothetical protein